MNDIILEMKNLKKYFPTKKENMYVKAVDGIDVSIAEGDFFGLIGESGSGKSTTAYMVMGIYEPTAGKVLYRKKDISIPSVQRSLSLKRELQIVFQDPGTSLNSQRTVGQIVSLPVAIHKRLHGKKLKNKVIEYLEEVELPAEYYYKHPNEIGGGEKQLVAIARALATDPSMIILDEPTSALDVSVQAKIINTLRRLQNNFDLSYLFITHDLSLMRNIATRVGIMYLGKIVEVGPVEELFLRPQHPYTKMLISSIPVVTKEEEKLRPKNIKSKGEIPSPVNVPPGCGFHTRCSLAEKICKEKEPDIISISEDHQVKCHLFDTD